MRFHAEILTADFWRQIQQRLQEGDTLEVLPYLPKRVRAFSSA
jgi:isocitrate dehydrogenase kinase/phosphatase